MKHPSHGNAPRHALRERSRLALLYGSCQILALELSVALLRTVRLFVVDDAGLPQPRRRPRVAGRPLLLWILCLAPALLPRAAATRAEGGWGRGLGGVRLSLTRR